MTTPTLTVVVPTRDDFHGAYFSVMSLLDHHREHITEIIVVDNSPQGSEHATLLAAELQSVSKLKGGIVHYDRIVGPESSCRYKDRGIRQATSDYVLCCDSHVLFPSGSIARLMEHYRQHPHTRDLIMGPCCPQAGKVMATHQVLYEWEGNVPADAEVHHGVVCRGGNLGAWAFDPRGLDVDAEPFEIQQQGTGAFSCRRDAWQGWPATFNGHGGNETFLMESVRQAGGKVLCLPGFQWTHRFGRTSDWEHNGQRSNVPYNMQWEPKLRNYLQGFVLLDKPQLYDAVVAHLKRFCPQLCAKVPQQIKRPPGLIDQLTPLWRAAGGDASGAVPQRLFHALRQRALGATYTLEFGSGLSTLMFDRLGKNHTAIEHSQVWHDRLRPLINNASTQLIYSPIDEQHAAGPWYRWQPPQGQQYDLVLIDGPPGTIGRAGCRHYLADCLAPSATILLDDTHRQDEQDLSRDLCAMYGFTMNRITQGGRAFDILTRTADQTIYNEGAGTELKRILADRWGMTAQASCGCNGRMREMNYRGAEWCRANIETIVNWLLDGAQHWVAEHPGGRATWIAIVPEFAKRTYLTKLVREAIAAAATWEEPAELPTAETSRNLARMQ